MRVCATRLPTSFSYRNPVQLWEVRTVLERKDCPLRVPASRAGDPPSPGTRHRAGKMFCHHLVVAGFLLLASKRGHHLDFKDSVSAEKLWHDSSGSSRQSLQAHQQPPCMLSRVRLFATLWTMAHQAPLSVGLSRQEYWSGWPFLSPN